MARMYARKKGKSGSKRPLRKSSPDWLDMSTREVEEKVVELYERGHSSSEVGMILRDGYGVPSVALAAGKKVTKILREKNIAGEIPEDITNLIKKALRIRKHMETNKKDFHGKRALQLAESKVRRLVKYYKREKVLPAEWEYKPEVAEFIIRR